MNLPRVASGDAAAGHRFLHINEAQMPKRFEMKIFAETKVIAYDWRKGPANKGEGFVEPLWPSPRLRKVSRDSGKNPHLSLSCLGRQLAERIA